MSQPNIEISTESVLRHANAVDDIADMINDGLVGASEVQASASSYGVLVGPLFTSLLNPFQDHAVGELKASVTATQALADTLRAMAGDFALTDQEVARRLEGA
ncbi:type VII secretion target [Winogradskya humida]|uniref:Excreted virulence factor EspC (Type VII ESX diderm) n=1 Tax=Winogradskya humida TaxID=113566 RepID=A0ABQ3ZGF6_9ACTN|nr:type VII secretion target [Actinoplanes humidus]GIE17659.1 hypothetical protein Ahu01nite_007610 [Actinoplanes humidus]